MTTRIIVADDHPLFRSAITNLLQRLQQQISIEEADSFASLETFLSAGQSLPSLVILDLKLPDINGLDGLLRLKKHYPELPVAIVSAYDDDKIIQQTRQYGASGFISKSLEMDDMVKAIKRILDGDLCFPDCIREITESHTPDGFNDLTPAQLKVLQLLKEGKPSKTMADTIGVTEATIKAHLTTIFRKLGVKNRTQAVIAANQLDLPDTFPPSQ
jgi:DNA-binding NarL/FixJ family response regulator